MTRKFALSGASVIVILLLCISYIFGAVLKSPILQSATTVTVELPRTGGLFDGSPATYRGVAVGKVTDLRLTAEGVEATVELRSGAKVPADTLVKVRSLSPVGEQYLDFQPPRDAGPYLENGARVTATAADLPQSLAGMAITLGDLIDQVDPVKVKSVLRSLSAGLESQADNLRLLVDQGGSLVEQLDENLPLTERLIRNANIVLTLGVEQAGNLRRATRSAKTFTAWLRGYDPQLFQLIDRAPGQIEELRALIADLSQTMPAFFDTTGKLMGILNARDPHLRELFIRYAPGVGSFAGAFQGDYVALNFVFKRGEQCLYHAQERSPRDTTYRAMKRDGSCSRDLTISQRGFQWAPPPVD